MVIDDLHKVVVLRDVNRPYPKQQELNRSTACRGHLAQIGTDDEVLANREDGWVALDAKVLFAATAQM